MTLRIASLLGAGCLCGQPWTTAAEVEYFPLSGGMDEGVQVRIKANLVSNSVETKIQFMTRDRTSAFTFHVDMSAKKIRRSAAIDADEDSSGGWPELTDGETEFVFTKRLHEMAVTIDGTRFPWFDYPNYKENGQAPLLTHVAVFDGMKDAEVTLTRPQCAKTCHPSECLDASGDSVCGHNTTCVSVTPSDTPGVASTCTADETTANGKAHCCDGSEVTPPLRDGFVAPNFAKLTSNTYLKRVCKAFNVDPCPDAFADGVGKVEVQSVNESTGEYSVFVPMALNGKTLRPAHPLPTTCQFKLPKFALADSFGKVSEGKAWLKSGTGSTFKVDRYHEVIVSSDQDALPKGWFVHFVELDLHFIDNSTRNMKCTKSSDSIRDNVGGNFTGGDETIDERELYDCVDSDLYDEQNNSCADYGKWEEEDSNRWCNVYGYPTEAGCQHFHSTACTNTTKLPKGRAGKNGKSIGSLEAASLQCCVCGGGHWTKKLAASLVE